MLVRLPPPVDDPLFATRAQAASYLGAWGLTATHLILWLLITIGLLTSEALVIGVSLLSFAATCLFIGMVIAAHRRLQLYHGGTTRHMATVWWRGPWDPVGRLAGCRYGCQPPGTHSATRRAHPRNQDQAADDPTARVSRGSPGAGRPSGSPPAMELASVWCADFRYVTGSSAHSASRLVLPKPQGA
jgi:hypothetical protein